MMSERIVWPWENLTPGKYRYTRKDWSSSTGLVAEVEDRAGKMTVRFSFSQRPVNLTELPKTARFERIGGDIQ